MARLQNHPHDGGVRAPGRARRSPFVTPLRARAAIAAGLFTLLLAAPAAGAQTPVLPEDFSAADQYVESVPTSSGPKPARKEKSKPGEEKVVPVPVPPAVSELGGKLEEVATSPALGAPEQVFGTREPISQAARGDCERDRRRR